MRVVRIGPRLLVRLCGIDKVVSRPQCLMKQKDKVLLMISAN